MSECTHHWTVTSECPYCLRAELAAARALLRESEVWLDIYTPQELRVRIDAALAGERKP